MKTRCSRVVLPALTLSAGILIGWASGGAGKGPATAAEAAKPEAMQQNVRRYGSVIGVKRQTVQKYIELHKQVWPGVLKMIKECNIRNYSIYLGELDEGNLYLFSYFEYTGDDFDADMEKMKADPTTRKWWSQTDPLQIPQKHRKPGEHWMTMREVFHAD